MANVKVAEAKDRLVEVKRKEDIVPILEKLDSDLDRFTALDLAVSFAESNLEETAPIQEWLKFYRDIYRGQK